MCRFKVLIIVVSVVTALLFPASVARSDGLAPVPFNADNWEFVKEATLSGSTVVLTRSTTEQVGQVWLKNRVIRDPFTVEFEYRVSNSWGIKPPVIGADGLVLMFFKQQGYSPGLGGTLGFTGGTSAPGYGVEFDTWHNVPFNDPSNQHIALLKDVAANHLTYANSSKIQDGYWHRVRAEVTRASVKVWLDGSLVLTFNGTLDRSYGGLGISAATGTDGTSKHEVRNFSLQTFDLTPPTTTATIPAPGGSGGWHTAPVSVNLSAADFEGGTGVREIRYRVNGGAEAVVAGNAATVPLNQTGVYTLSYYAVDHAGHTEAPQSATVSIDMSAPAATVIDAALPDLLTAATFAVPWQASDSGAGVQGAKLWFSRNGGPWTQYGGLHTASPVTFVSASGDGLYAFSMTAVDYAGNAEAAPGGTASAEATALMDTTPPVITIAGGDSASTPSPSPTVSGTTDAPNGQAVTVSIGGASYTGTVSGGTWSTKVTAVLPDGTYPVTAWVKDLAGHTGTDSQSLTVLNAPPAPGGDTTVVSPAPILEDSAPPEFPNVQLVVPTLSDSSGVTPSQVRLFGVTGGVLRTGEGAPGAGSPILLGPAGTLLTLTGGAVSLRFTPDANRDQPAAFSYAVVDPHRATLQSAASTATIPITPVNDPPVLSTSGGDLFYTAGAAVVDASLQISDIDSPTLSGATVSIAGYLPAEDRLDYTATAAVSGPFDAAAGVLRLAGAASIADYQAVLRSVTFTRAGRSVQTRTVTFQVSDGQALSSTASRRLIMPPEATAAPLPEFLNSRSVPVGWTAEDGSGLGIASVQLYFSLDGGATWNPYGGGATSSPIPFSAEADGPVAFSVRAASNSGHREAPPAGAGSIEAATTIDTVPPEISGSRTAPNANGWNNGNVEVTFTCTDHLSGVASCTAPVILGAEGAGQSASGTATDKAGNNAAATVGEINIDRTAPVVTYTGNAGSYTVDQSVTILCTAGDSLSGVESSTCATISGPAWSFAVGQNTYAATVTDRAGNVGAGSTSFTVTVTSDSLSNLIRSFSSSGDVAQGLIDKLEAARAAADRGNGKAKAGQINAFIKQVEAQIGKAFTAEEAEILIRLARLL